MMEGLLLMFISRRRRCHRRPAGRKLKTAARHNHDVVTRIAGGGTVLGRLRADLGLDDTRRQLAAITPAGDAESPPGDPGAPPSDRVRLTSLLDQTASPYHTTVLILAGAIVLLIGLACVNLTGLVLARGAARSAELAVRASLGAGRWRIARQLLVESLALAVTAGAAGILMAQILLGSLVAVLPRTLPPGTEATIGWRVLGAGLLLATMTGLVFGVLPAFRLSRATPGRGLAGGARSTGLPLSRRGSQILIAVEVALSVVLLSGAGLMIRSFDRLTSVDLGFNPSTFMAFVVSPVDQNPEHQRDYYLHLLDALRATPGVSAAGAIDLFPLGGAMIAFGVTGDVPGSASVHAMLPGLFEAMGLEARRGRLPAATAAPGAPVAVVNASAARILFPDGAVGRSLHLTGRTESFTVVAMVDDMVEQGPAGRPGPAVYLPFPAWSMSAIAPGLTIVVRPDGTRPDLAAAVHHTAESLGQPVVVDPVKTGWEWFAERVVVPFNRTILLSLLGGLGLLLTLIGIFGVTAYAVARRKRDIGVRLALGARPSVIVRGAVRDAAWPGAIGLAAGLALAWQSGAVLRSFLFATTPHDRLTFVAVVVIIGTTMVAAAWIPARRAAHVDPTIVLRAE
jgi:putative ABC transport system permease protein